MQRGIDSFFKRVTPAAKDVAESPKPAAQKKRKARVISSDEEDAIPESPQVGTKSRENKKLRVETKTKTLDDAKLSSKPVLSKLKNSPKKERKAIDPTALFGAEPVRVEAPKPPKPKDLAVLELEDDEIDKSLMEIDVDKSILESEKVHEREKVIECEKKERHSRRSKSKTPRKDKDSSSRKASKSPSSKSSKSPSHRAGKSLSPKKEEYSESRKHKELKEEKLSPSSGAKKSKRESEEEPKTPKVEHKHKEKEKEKSAHKTKAKSTPKVKREHSHDDLESSVLSDEERHERKRMSAMLYQKFKNRSSVINPGSKEVPKGAPNCLAGHTFLVTGVLESLERDEAGSIIKEYGGKLMTTVGKRLNYLIVGEDAGPKKLADAEELGVKIISEDELFDLIREKSGGKTTNGKAVKEEKPSTSPKVKKEKTEVEIKKEKSILPEKKRRLEESVKKEELNNNAETKIQMEIVKNEEKELEFTPTTKPEVDEAMLAWVDKYKPTSVKDIVGQFGASSNVAKLTNWLSKWYINHDGKKKLQKPNPWAKNDDGSYYKAALLSGPPGIGKTTTATLVCKELGFDAVEFNASDTRSKRLLKEEVAELLSCKSLYGYFHGNAQAMTKKHVLIMDEVDGMAGNEDRGGIQELIGLIKESSVPIVCMCNDRNHQKMRSLVNYCYDLRFNKPRLEQIKGRIMSICCKEKFKIEPAKVEEIITATNNDIRQTINHISLLSAGKHMPVKADSGVKGEAQKTAEKDLKMGPWEVVRKVFSADEHKHMSFYDKCDLFFHDYSLSPLFVQQNYLQVSPVGPKSDVLRKVALTADALSLGDLVDKRIRSLAAWTLLPTQAVFSSVMPGEYMCGHFTGQINFPGWLGKNSRSSKRSRLAQEIHDHTRLRTSGSRQSIRLDYAPYLLANIVRPLKERGLEGVQESLNVLKEYHLLREDIDGLIDLTTWPGKKGIMEAVDGRVKAALTRAYNKEVMAYSYSATAGVKKKRAEAADEAVELLGAEGEEDAAVVVDSDEEKDDDNLENDGLIKAKKKPASAAASTSKASTSKAKAATKAGGATKSKAAGSTSKAKK